MDHISTSTPRRDRDDEGSAGAAAMASGLAVGTGGTVAGASSAIGAAGAVAGASGSMTSRRGKSRASSFDIGGERMPLIELKNTGHIEAVEVEHPAFSFAELVRDKHKRIGLPPRC